MNIHIIKEFHHTTSGVEHCYSIECNEQSDTSQRNQFPNAEEAIPSAEPL